MNDDENEMRLKKKKLWAWSQGLAVLVLAANFIIYLSLHLKNGHWHEFSQLDIEEIKSIQLGYEFPWWSNVIFSLAWLAFALGVYWYLDLKNFGLKQEMGRLPAWPENKRSERQAELEGGLFLNDLYRLGNLGGVALGLIAAAYCGGALYGLALNLVFDLYCNLFLVALSLALSLAEPLFKWPRKIFKKNRCS